jgi:hypothetical protein
LEGLVNPTPKLTLDIYEEGVGFSPGLKVFLREGKVRLMRHS